MSQSETIATFGLGMDVKYETFDFQMELTVIWPGGSNQILSVSELDTTILVKQP